MNSVMATIIQNTTITYPIKINPLTLWYNYSEIEDFKEILITHYLNNNDMIFKQSSNDDLIDYAIEQDYTVSKLRMSSDESIRVEVKINKDLLFNNSFLVPVFVGLEFKDAQLKRASVDFDFRSWDYSATEKNTIFLSFIKNYLKKDKKFKCHFFKNGISVVDSHIFVDEKDLNKEFFEKSLENDFKINLNDIVTKNSTFYRINITDDSIRFKIDQITSKNREKNAIKAVEFSDNRGFLECKELLFLDELSRQILISKVDDRINISHEKSVVRFNLKNENDFLFIDYQHNVYPKKFKGFNLIGNVFDLFDIKNIDLNRQYNNHFENLPIESKLKKAVVNFLMVNNHTKELNEILGKDVMDSFNDEDYELLRMNLEKIKKLEDIYDAMERKMDLLYNSLLIFEDEIGSDKHYLYLKENIEGKKIT